MKTLGKILLAVMFATLLTSSIVYGATTWSQTISWTYTNSSFQVDNTETGSPLNLGIVNGTQTKIYTVNNTGNVPITVNALATPTGATASWNKDSDTIAVGASTTFTLTLVITGNGTCTVNFARV